jgi:drug/metabolite transporter (DMT)-like permease
MTGAHVRNGIGFAILAALCFGASTPLSKILLRDQVSPLILAGLLYLGSGAGLSVLRLIGRGRARAESALTLRDAPWLGSAIFFGAITGASLLLWGLNQTPSSTASLLLNLEGVFTAGLAWVVFRESVDRRVLLGMLCILAGGVALSWQGGMDAASPIGIAAIVAACLCWGIDNNLTQKVSARDPFQIAAIKGLVAGAFNTTLGLALGGAFPPAASLVAALLIGFAGYGLSLALFVLALREIGTARTGAYFAVAPFVGAALSILLLGERPTWTLVVAAALMGIGLWLHLTERHVHTHVHPVVTHSHRHTHDAHHAHQHGDGVDATQPHAHEHAHQPDPHAHVHFPDAHHRHEHGDEKTI